MGKTFGAKRSKGCTVKIKGLNKAAYTDNDELYLQLRSKLIVSSLYGRRRSLSVAGQSEGAVQRQEMKCAVTG